MFAADLLDGWEVLYKRTDGVLKSCTDISDFFRHLAKCEREYGKSLVKLAQAQKKDFQKATPVQKEAASTFDCWDKTLTELEKAGEYHNQLADKIENDVSKEIANYVKEKSKTRKKLEADGQRLTKDFKTAQENLQKARGKYVTLSKEADAAEAQHNKGKGDVNVKPNVLQKMAAKASQATDKAAAADNEYQATLSATNQKQTEYYTSTMPALLTEFQQFEEDRIKVMKDTLQKFGGMNGEKPAFYTASCDSINYAIESIAIDADIGAWVNENRTGVTVPADIQYIPYDSEVPASPKPNNRLTSNPSSLNLASSGNSNTSSSSGKAKPPPVGKYKAPGSADILSSREWGLSASDKNLGTEEQQSKLSGQLAELDKAQAVETKTKEGLENLVRFYATDPVAQKKAEDQLSESEQKIQRISETRQMVESQLTELGGSYGDSGSGGGYSGSSYSAGGGSGKKVRGLYDYTATCDTELSFKEGEILSISEQDDSGWWYAELNGQTGFVPNNYVEEI